MHPGLGLTRTPRPPELVRTEVDQHPGVTMVRALDHDHVVRPDLRRRHAEHAGARLPASLRLVWLSGDWIPLSLPARIRALSDCAALQLISLGGAPEAAGCAEPGCRQANGSAACAWGMPIGPAAG